jgi:hypothetical protein
VFDDQHNMWTNVFASVCVYSSQDAKVTWTKTLRKATVTPGLQRREVGGYSFCFFLSFGGCVLGIWNLRKNIHQ